MAETTTISNLPQITIDELTNDTLVPVENVDGTKAANLAQLRKKLNSLYVEMVDADLNELKQDGIYECWGTTINAPTSEVAAWIIQTAEHGGVVVQNAFGLGTTSYSYVYRRRWNGVSWTAWENKIQTLETVKANVDLSNLSAAGQAKFNAKANVSNTVTTDTAQTITGIKTFKGVVTAELEPINFIAKNPTMDVNVTPSANKYVGYDFRDKNNVRIGYIGIHQGTDGIFQYEMQNPGNSVKKIMGITPPSNSIKNEMVTAEWFKKSECSIRTVVEAYGTNEGWYRIWNDGWKEQGGYVKGPSPNITFLKPFTNEGYSFIKSLYIYGSSPLSGSPNWVEFCENNRTKTGISLFLSSENSQAYWYACGY